MRAPATNLDDSSEFERGTSGPYSCCPTEERRSSIQHFMANGYRQDRCFSCSPRTGPRPDLENLESSVGQFGVAQLLADYDSACPDRVRSLNNFIALSSYADKIHPSANLIARSENLIGEAKTAVYPKTEA